MDLSKECYSQEMSNSHLVAISTAHCTKWRLLPPDLELENAVVGDTERKSGDERERRYDFLAEWKQQKGAGATYKALITALQKIGCQGDAEYVFKLAQPLSAASRPTTSISTQTETKNGAASTQTEAKKNGVAGPSISNTAGMRTKAIHLHIAIPHALSS